MERIVYRKTLDVHKNGVQFTLQGFETADNLSRRVEINLMASGDAIDFPLERLVAMMYVTTPNAAEPSINACTIKGNKVVYDVLPIVEEGITEMRLKLIETSPEGAKRVLMAPKFAVEVIESNVDDESVEQTTTFTALEDAVAKASAVYNERFLRMEIDQYCIFRAYYADGTVYETDALKECLLHGNALLSKSYAVGDSGIREGENTDNSMYYSNVSRSSAAEAKGVGDEATKQLEETRKHSVYTSFTMDFESGLLKYISPNYSFNISADSGELLAESSDVANGELATPDEEKASAGRVLIIPRGNWCAETIYNPLDLVNHNGISWIAKKTSVGFEPSNDYAEYWYNLLNVDDLIQKALAETTAEKVGNLLEDRFRDMLSEAKYVTDLKADFTEATFVQWNAETENTPYKAGITESTEGFALVYGMSALNHTIVTWTTGTEKSDCFICSISNGESSDWESYLEKWESCLSKSGGTLTGPLGLGDGKGTVSADEEGAFLRANEDDKNYREIVVISPKDAPIDEAAKIVSTVNGQKKEYYLFGNHNLPNVAQIVYGTYVGTGTSGVDNPNTLTADFDIKLALVYQSDMGWLFGHDDSDDHAATKTLLMAKGATSVTNMSRAPAVNTKVNIVWSDNTVSWYCMTPNNNDAEAQWNANGTAYHYILIG